MFRLAMTKGCNMRLERQYLQAIGMVVALLALGGCSADSNDRVTTPRDQLTLPEALDGYWPAQTTVAGTLDDLEAMWLQIEAGVAAGEDVTAQVEQYAVTCEAAADRFDHLLDLEEVIVPYGDDKGHFSSAARAIITEVYETAEAAIERSGQRLRTAWLVYGGTSTLRDAVRDRESGVDPISAFSDRLRARLAARDALILTAILADDDHDGLLPLDLLAGATPAERAEAYGDLGDANLIKLQARRSVPNWDASERTATIDDLRLAAREEIRAYALAASSPQMLDDLADQLLAPAQSRTDTGTLAQALSDAATGEPLVPDAMLVLMRRGQPSIAILTGAAADLALALPAGSYDAVVVAPGYLRAVAQVDVPGNDTAILPLALYDVANHRIILESLTADFDVVGAGETATLRALAVSTLARELTFTWAVAGPASDVLTPAGPTAAFTAATPGTYAVTLTVADGQAETSLTTFVEVIAGAVRVAQVAAADGAFVDGAVNPGESVVLTLSLEGHAEGDLSGNATLTGLGGALVTAGGSQAFTLTPGTPAAWPVTVTIPTDFAATTARFAFAFTLDDRVVQQVISVPVDFYTELNAPGATVTSRVLPVTGRVANPALSRAWLVVDGDPGQIHEVRLTNGAFAETILLQGARRSRRVTLELVADSGARRETDRVSFTANIPAAGLRVALTWDTPETDVDLWVTDPNGEKCYFAHRTTALGLMLDVDDVTGWGPENITVIRPPAGEYLVQVHYWDDWDGVQRTASTCTVAIWQDEGTDEERVVTYTGTLGQTGDLWTVAVVTVSEDKAAGGLRVDGARAVVPPAALPPK
jgi:uncharacterized protein YfaP (DUF2135 family)